MRVTIASRIYNPEVSAASVMLSTWADEFARQGHEVTVLTARPPRGAVINDPPGITIKRARVKRDRQQYVRGYLSYMSFDIPLAFRVLFSKAADVYLVEPPPTTVAVMRVATALKRRPYAVRAADYWTDAAELVVRSRAAIRWLGWLEKWGLNGAAVLFAAHDPLIGRFRQAGVSTRAIPIGFGADLASFHYAGQEPPTAPAPVFVYAGTHASWHGAGIFVDALAQASDEIPEARLVFYGVGDEREPMQRRAKELGIDQRVEFHAPVPPSQLAPILASATACLASLLPSPANEYAVATKVYSSLAAGCPVIFAGIGPTDELLAQMGSDDVGIALPYDIDAVRNAMVSMAKQPLPPHRRQSLATWCATTFSLEKIAQRVVSESVALTTSKTSSSTTQASKRA